MGNDLKKDNQTNCIDHQLEVKEIINDKYVVVKKLGRGGSSSVWQCLDLHSSQQVALKIVKKTTGDTSAAIDEIKMLKRIGNSDKFVQLLTDFKLECANRFHTCIVLELMKENVLQSLKSSGRREMPLNDVKSIIWQVLDGLDYLHTKCQLIHTDIKPNNILISDYDNLTVKIADLGSACSVKNARSKGFQTARYQSHEFLLDAPYGTSTDIWSTACMAFELATGHGLFVSKAGEGYSKAEDHLACTIALLGEIPKHVALSGRRSYWYFTRQGKLRHITKRKPWKLSETLQLKYNCNARNAVQFAHLLLSMLAFDSYLRPSARDCIKHPCIQSYLLNRKLK